MFDMDTFVMYGMYSDVQARYKRYRIFSVRDDSMIEIKLLLNYHL